MTEVDPQLELSNEALEDVMAAVNIWCRDRKVAMSSAGGKNALKVATQLRSNSELTSSQLLRRLTRELYSVDLQDALPGNSSHGRSNA